MKLVDKIRNAVDVKDLLNHYGASRVHGVHQLRSTCPIHGGDNPNALVFDEHEKLWYCHTGCQEGGSVFDFVMKMEGVEFRQAAEMLAEMFKVEVDWNAIEVDDDLFELEAKDFIKHTKKKRNSAVRMPEYQYIGNLRGIKAYRNFSKEAIDFWGVQVARDGVLMDRIVIPLEDELGRIVGYSGRRIYGNMQFKWKHKPDGFHSGFILPGLGKNKEEIIQKSEIILVEGSFDSIPLWDAGLKHVAAVMGANFTDEQMRLVQRFVTRVVVCFDGDTAGRKATQKVIDKLKLTTDVYVMVLPDGKDPGDLTHDELREAYQNKIRAIEFTKEATANANE
ncbi:toprim domain-containing protein [Enterococcus faecalis]|nr:toprim domain-containing protein [Enterococcus faecalis]